jgi:hypothetical protein
MWQSDKLRVDSGRDRVEEIAWIVKMEKIKLIMVTGWML